MSGKKMTSYDSRCTSDSSQEHHPHLPLDNTGGISTESFKSSEKSVYESRSSDSGIWSGSNIHSEEIQSPLSESHKTTSEFSYMPSSEQVSGDKSSTYMRLDSGIDVSHHLSELSLKDNDSYNDLSVKDVIIVSSKDSSVSKSSNSSTPAADLSLADYCFQQNEDGDTDLHLAIVHQFIETVYALVRLAPHPKYLNIRNNDRQTPLHLAVLTQQPRLVRLLVCAGAALDELDQGGNTALHLAVQNSDLNCVHAIISSVTVSEINQSQLQYTPASSNKLIADIYNYEGQTCIHLAALSGNLNIFQHLLWAGANINAKEWKGGLTCLHLAVESKDVQLCKFLLTQEKINMEEINYSGHTAYQMACKGWDESIAQKLRDHGVDTYESDSSESDDEDMLVNSISCLQVNGGLVDVGA